MLKLNSLFWAAANPLELTSQFEKLGFRVENSHRYPENKCVFFGPDSFELMKASEKTGSGIIGLEFESEDISSDYKNYQKTFGNLAKPMIAKNQDTTQWYGFYLPTETTPGFESWIVMTSPDEMKNYDQEILPRKHSNSAFGFESVSFSTSQTEEVAKKWSQTLAKPYSQITWREFKNTSSHRLLAGDKFIDAVNMGTDKAFMVTVKVSDLELAKKIATQNGFKIFNCNNRDGFIVDASSFDGIYVRFVRHFWKKYLPLVKSHFPYYRREDKFRPLGGAYTSTLEQGFEDDWSY